MNISDLGALGGDAPGKSREAGGRERVENRTKIVNTGENTQPELQQSEETRETAPRDEFRTSENRRRIEELAKAVEEAPEETRRERVEQARERIAAGYYNSEEFMGSLALRLINTGLNG